MANWNYQRLSEDIVLSRSDEIQCDAALHLMAEITNPYLSVEESKRLYPQLWRHFHFCPRCAEEYTTLLNILQAPEMEMATIRVPSLPKSENWSTILLRKLGDTVKSIAVQPQLGWQVRGAEQKVYTATIDGFTANIAIQQNLRDDQLFDLICTFASDIEVDQTALEGSQVSLLETSTGTFVQEGTLDENGDVILSQVPSTTYKLLLQPFLFEQIEV